MSEGSPRHFIKAWRKHRGFTQVQLAERLGIARSYLSQIEAGKRRYDQPFLERAAPILDCAVSDLIASPPGGLDELLSVWSSIPEQDRPRALAILRTFSE